VADDIVIRTASESDAGALALLSATVQELHVAERPDVFKPVDLGALASWFRDAAKDPAWSERHSMKPGRSTPRRYLSASSAIGFLVGALLGCGCEGQRDVTARRYDVAGACWGTPEVVGSLPRTACDDALQVASKGGACFLFTQTCVPDGFQPVSSNDDACPQVDAPSCSR